MKTLLLATFIFLLDQGSKWAALAVFKEPGAASITIIPGFFDLSLVWNKGAAWGMLAGKTLWLAGVSAIMLVLLILNRKEFMANRLGRFATGILGGGIAGNLLDRLVRGYVVDFLDFHWPGFSGETVYFPVFNLADTAIFCGVVLLVISSLPCFRTEP